jgi:hypothetical protein
MSTYEIRPAEVREILDGLILGKQMGIITGSETQARMIMHELNDCAMQAGISSSLVMSWALMTISSEQGGKVGVLRPTLRSYRGLRLDRAYLSRDLDPAFEDRIRPEITQRAGSIARIGETREQHAARAAEWNAQTGKLSQPHPEYLERDAEEGTA